MKLLGKKGKRGFKRKRSGGFRSRKRRKLSAVDRSQNRQLRRLNKSIETKYAVRRQEVNVTNDLIEPSGTPANMWSKGLYKQWIGISQGDADNGERIGDKLDVTSIQFKYTIEHDPTDVADSSAHVRVCMFLDNDPVYAKAALYVPPAPGQPQIEENPVGWSQLLFQPLQGDATPATTLDFRQRDIMKSKRFTMLYDKVHTLIQNTTKQVAAVNLCKKFMNGKTLQFLAAGTQPINSQLYIGVFSNHPLASAPIMTYTIQTLYKDA